MAGLTKDLADDQIVGACTRERDANLGDRSDGQSVERPEIPDHGTVVSGLTRAARRRAVRPRALTGTRPFLDGGLFRPLERCPDDLAAIAPKRVQRTPAVQRE